MITSLSEQPWGRRELDPPQRLRGLSGSLRGSCAQPGRDCVAWSLLPHPWGGTDRVGWVLSERVGRPLSSLRGLPSSCRACPALPPLPPKSCKAPRVRKSDFRVPLASVWPDAQALYGNLQRTARHYRDGCARTPRRVPARCASAWKPPPGAGVPTPRRRRRGWEPGEGCCCGIPLVTRICPAWRLAALPPRTPLPGWDPRSRCRLLRGTSPVPAARSAPPVPGGGVRPGAGPARPGRPLRGRGSSRVGSAEPGARCPPGSQRGSRRRGTPLRFRARRLTAAPQPASSSSLPIKCRNSGL